MKVSLISNYNIGYLKENKQISNTSNSKFERNITAPSFKAGIIKHGLIVSCFFLPLGCFTTSCNSDKSQNTPTEQVEITNGRLVNRSDAEIENITGLNPIQFEVAKQLLLDEVNYVFSKRWGQMYFKDTEYCRDIKNIFGHSFYMNFTNGIDELKILGKSGKNYYGFYWPVPGGYDFRPKIRVIQEPDGNFTIITSGSGGDNNIKVRIHNFDKHGGHKEGSSLPKSMSSIEQQLEKKNEEESERARQLEENTTLRTIENIDLFKNKDKKTIAKFINALGLKNVEYINKKGGNIFFFDGDNCSYRLNLSQMHNDDKTYTGILNKATSAGKSEIYIVKAEMFSTNKSDKLILSMMRVVQDGLNDDAPIYKKDIKEIKETGESSSSASHNVNLESIQDWRILQLFKNLGDWRKNIEGDISSETQDVINKIVTESYSEGITLKIVSIDKATGKVNVQG